VSSYGGIYRRNSIVLKQYILQQVSEGTKEDLVMLQFIVKKSSLIGVCQSRLLVTRWYNF